MKNGPAITLLSIALVAASCSDPSEDSSHDISDVETAWTESELLSMVVKLNDSMSRADVSAILGDEDYGPLDHGNGCIKAHYVQNPDSFIGRHWVSGGPHSFTGLTASFIDDRLVYISLNPGYVDQDRLEDYYEAHPIDHEGSDVRGHKRWELFHDTQSSRRIRGESGSREVLTPDPHTTDRTDP